MNPEDILNSSLVNFIYILEVSTYFLLLFTKNRKVDINTGIRYTFNEDKNQFIEVVPPNKKTKSKIYVSGYPSESEEKALSLL